MKYKLEFTGVKVFEADSPEDAVDQGRVLFSGQTIGSLMDLKVVSVGESVEQNLDVHSAHMKASFRWVNGH